jgi:hypothetical protein
MVLVAIVVAPAFLAAEPPKPRMIEKAGTYKAVVDETVRFVFKYDGFAGQIITGLEISIDGKTVKRPKVESTMDPDNVEMGAKIYVHRPDKTGTFRIKITPLRDGSRGTPKEFVLKVTD